VKGLSVKPWKLQPFRLSFFPFPFTLTFLCVIPAFQIEMLGMPLEPSPEAQLLSLLHPSSTGTPEGTPLKASQVVPPFASPFWISAAFLSYVFRLKSWACPWRLPLRPRRSSYPSSPSTAHRSAPPRKLLGRERRAQVLLQKQRALLAGHRVQGTGRVGTLAPGSEA